MLTEARIILPKTTGSMDITPVHNKLRRLLVETFGGYTRFDVSGAWRDPKTGEQLVDHSIAYDVAVDAVDELVPQALRKICGIIAADAIQRCIYLRLPNGSVEFVDNPGVAKAKRWGQIDFIALLFRPAC